MKHLLPLALALMLLLAIGQTADARPRPKPTPAPTPSPLRSVSVAWTSISRATGYRLYFGRGSRTYPQIVNAGRATTYRVSGLTRGVTYYFAVKAYNAAGSSSYSVEKTYRPL